MIAAIYARKSTEQNVTEDAKSITRQIETARVFAVKNGWTVEHIYSDDGISGAEFMKREGLALLMNAVKSKPRPFDILVVMDESRLGRKHIETSVY
jgi:DNA invertase Pin-like site-specific DNA recombinase